MGEQAGWLKVRSEHVALASVLLAIGAVAALIVVATAKSADALSTIALSLAILAFLIQVIFFIAQTGASTAINAQTSALLAEVRTKVEGVSTVVGGQNERLLAAVLHESIKQGKVAEDSGAPGNIHELVRRAESSLTQQASDASHVNVEIARGPSAENSARLRTLRSFPEKDEGLKSWAVLRTLSPLAAAMFQRFSEDERDSLTQNLEPGLPITGVREALAKELVDKGLLQRTEGETPKDSRHWYELTPTGRESARIFVGRGKAPEYFREFV